MHFVLRHRNVALKTFAVLLVATALSSCSDTHTGNELSGLESIGNPEPSLLLDSTVPLPDAVTAFRLLNVNATSAVSSLEAELRYEDSNSQSSITQKAYRTDENAPFGVLVPPFNIDQDTQVDVFLETINTSEFVGTLTIAALPNLLKTSNPGEYSLLGMNAILKELISAKEISRLGNPNNNENDSNPIDLWHKDLDELVENFQAIVNINTDAVVFNSPVIIPGTDSVLIDQHDFASMDRIFFALSQRLVKTGMLFDGNDLAQAETTGPDIDQSFSLFAHAVEDFISTPSGIQVLASLSINVENASDPTNLAATLDIFRATLTPSLITQLITYDSSNSAFPDTASRELFYTQTDTIDLETAIASTDNFILKNAYETLNWLKLTMMQRFPI